MKFEKRMKCGQKMLEENVRRPFVNWYKKVKRIIDKLPDETEVYGVSIIFDTDQNLNNAQEMDKLEERYECKAAFLPDLSEIMLDVNNKLKLEEDEFVFREKLENMALDPKCKDTEISNTFWVTKVIVLFAKILKFLCRLKEQEKKILFPLKNPMEDCLKILKDMKALLKCQIIRIMQQQ